MEKENKTWPISSPIVNCQLNCLISRCLQVRGRAVSERWSDETIETMKTRNCGGWSELPFDILRSVFESLSYVDFHRTKIVCLNWYSCSKQTVRPKRESPFLMLIQDDGFELYNPDEDRVYKPKRDLSRLRFLGNSGKWFLVVDTESNLSIIDMFSDKKFQLPPLESIKGGDFSLERVGDGEFKEILVSDKSFSIQKVENLRGVLWFDETNVVNYVVVWYFVTGANYIAFCHNRRKHYCEIPTRMKVVRKLRGISDMLVRGDRLYVLTTRIYVRVLDLSGQEGFRDVSKIDRFPMLPPDLTDDEFKRIRSDTRDGQLFSYGSKIAVTTSGEVLLVESIQNVALGHRIFRLFKKDPNTDPGDEVTCPKLIKVDCLGDEALFLDFGITVPADHTFGIVPNSIYFTHYPNKSSYPDVCVYNLATNTFKCILTCNSNLKDVRWVLPFPSPYW